MPKTQILLNEQASGNGTHVLVTCAQRERLHLLPEECLFIKDKNNQVVQKLRVCSICPILQGAFGRKISRAVVTVQTELVLT